MVATSSIELHIEPDLEGLARSLIDGGNRILRAVRSQPIEGHEPGGSAPRWRVDEKEIQAAFIAAGGDNQPMILGHQLVDPTGYTR